jgi:hypothetical protein
VAETAAVKDEIEVQLDQIEVDPENIRTRYDETVLQGLRQALRNEGEYINPPVVYETAPGKYRVKHGSTRVLAAQGVVDKLKVRVREAPKNERAKMLAQMSENLLQGGLGPMDVGWTLRKMRDEGNLSLGQIVGALRATGIDRSRAWVLRHLALTELDPGVQEAVASGAINPFQADRLKGLPPAEQREWLQRIVEQHLPAETLDRLLGRRPDADGGGAPDPAERRDAAMADVDERITEAAARLSEPDRSVAPRRSEPSSGPVTRRWALLPLNVEAQVKGRARGTRKLETLNHLDWTETAGDVERQLAQEALFFGGHSPQESIDLVERAVDEAQQAWEPVVVTLNGVRQLLESPSRLPRDSALAEFLRIRLRRVLANLG